MSLDEIHEMAIRINNLWDSFKLIKREYMNDSDFYKMIETAYFLAKASE